MIYVINIVRLLFTVYMLMLVVRIFGSWFPSFQNSSFFRFLSHYTDPYLNIFRRFIPPIGGVLDLSPILGFFALQFLQYLVTRLLLMFL
ncbi:MAG: YggT family protein [Simkaniaceae bacterium]|nr:YggT family protein [Simkaniaceae bacterium]